ncbi:MAG: hypothetical protein IJF20_07415 [Clostridia bacterium]|nr:hypothetical protein [Clostridia bacterium]
MKKITKIMAVVLSFVFIFSMISVSANAAEKDNTCTIKLTSSKAEPKPGDSFTVTVSAKTDYPVINVNTIIVYDTDYYALDTSNGAAVKKSTKMPVSMNQSVNSPLGMYHQSYSSAMTKQYKLVFSAITWLPSLASEGTSTPTTTLKDFEKLYTIKFKMKSNAPTDGNGFLGIDEAYIKTANSTMRSGVYAAHGGATLGDDVIATCGQTYDLSQAVLFGDKVEKMPADKTFEMNYKDVLNASALVSSADDYEVLSSDTSIVDTKGDTLTAKKAGTVYVAATANNGKTRTNYEVTVKYTWWQWIIMILLFGWLWY